MMKLYRFDYSPYVRKVQMALDLMGADYQAVDVPYGDRTELVELTGQWEREHEGLIRKAAELLEPTLQTLKKQPFVFGGEPTLADAALYGQFMMLKVAAPGLPARVSKAIAPWMESLEQRRRAV